MGIRNTPPPVPRTAPAAPVATPQTRSSTMSIKPGGGIVPFAVHGLSATDVRPLVVDHAGCVTDGAGVFVLRFVRGVGLIRIPASLMLVFGPVRACPPLPLHLVRAFDDEFSHLS